MTNVNWISRRVCGPVTTDYDPWFSDDPDEKDEARAVCSTCPVSAQCLSHSLVNKIPFGIFGGLDGGERKPLQDNLFSGTPREVLDTLQAEYLLPEIERTDNPVGHEASVATKNRVRAERAERGYEVITMFPRDEVPHYDAYIDCLRAVLHSPNASGEQLGKMIQRSTAMFNQRLRECFEFCGV